MGYWHGKVALVTGGSAGLGLAIAKTFGLAGARVAAASRRAGPRAFLISGADKRTIVQIPADVTCQGDVERMVAEVVSTFGRLDVLVNCVGQSGRGDALTTPPEEFARLFELNFVSMVRCTQAAAKHLVESRGHIVNIGSLAGKTASRYLGAYPASKFPFTAFSQQLRLELGPQGVHTLLVCPGPILRDDAGQRYADQTADLPDAANQPGGGVKLKGIDPDKLAAMILRACERRQAELIVPWWAKILFAVQQLSPRVGDWMVGRATKA